MAANENLHVSGLPAGFDEETVKAIFSAYGDVTSVKVMGQSAFIKYATLDEAKWVQENLDGNIPEGLAQTIQVKFAGAATGKGKGKDNAKGGWGKDNGKGGWGKDNGKGGFPSPAPNDNVFLADLPVGMDKSQLEVLFSGYGTISDSRMLPGWDPNSKPCALVRFSTVEQAKWVVENLNGNIPEGLSEPIICRFANDGSQRKGYGKDNGKTAGDSWGPYAKGGKDGFKGGKNGFKGKDLGNNGIRTLVETLCSAGALPGGMEYENDVNTLFVAGLPSDTKSVDLYKMFSPFGAIAPKGILAMMSKATGQSTGNGFVNFMDPSASQAAIDALNGTTMGDEGAVLTVRSKSPDDNKGDGEDVYGEH